MDNQEGLIEERKGKILNFLKQKKIWVLGLLIVAVILGIYIRSLPMTDHGNGLPGLWDIAKNNWTLGPDLDPWFFTRYAKTIVEQGSLPEIDTMRNVPLGIETSRDTILLPYMIVWTYNLVNIFGNYNVEFAAALFPVIMFALTIISFFLFVREVFVSVDKKSKTKADIIALISTFFMIVVPEFLARTIAGIPEKESAAFFFMFLSFYLFLKAWKSESTKKAVIFSVLAGVSTALMGLIWGGVSYVFVAIGVAGFIAFILNKVKWKEFIIYSVWILVSFILLSAFPGQYSLSALISSLDSGLAFLVFFIFAVHFIIWKTKISKIGFFERIKIPKNILSLIIAVIIGILFSMILFGPGFLIEKGQAVNRMLFKPVIGRWDVTVAENRQPHFTEWRSSFGPFIKNIPIMFWLFFIGSVVLFKKMLSHIKRKDSLILTIFYILFFLGLVFSRYAPHPSILDGENFISKAIYYVSALLLIGGLIYYYAKYHQEGNMGFEQIQFSSLFLIGLLLLCIFTARSAVRLVMVLAVIAPIFVAYLIVESFSEWKKLEKGTKKNIIGLIFIIVVLLGLFAFWNYYGSIKYAAYYYIPSNYNQQWQKAMDWAGENTPADAVFAHWWDYGYWVQSIGERATVLDGGNIITFWNYLMGRLVLTGDNQADSLEFLYNHNVTHLLIDSTDIGKYGAFSSIGSDKNFDRYSAIPTMLLNNAQTQETANGRIMIYQGGIALDEDVVLTNNDSQVFLPAGNTAVGGIIIETKNNENETFSIDKAHIAFFYNNKQVTFPLRYVYFNGQFIDLGDGLKGTAYLVETIVPSGTNINVNGMGAMLYLSPRVMRGFLAQKYLLNDPFNNFPNFKLAYSEPSFIVSSLRAQGLGVQDFIFYNGIQGPIKIWSVKYTGKEQIVEKYTSTEPEKYIDWEL